jgi:hypothetical protein
MHQRNHKEKDWVVTRDYSLRRLLPLLPRPRILPPQHRLQEPPGIAARDLDDIIRRA